VCRNRYQAWQDTVRGLQKIVRDDVETNIQVLDAGEVRPAARVLGEVLWPLLDGTV